MDNVVNVTHSTELANPSSFGYTAFNTLILGNLCSLVMWVIYLLDNVVDFTYSTELAKPCSFEYMRFECFLKQDKGNNAL